MTSNRGVLIRKVPRWAFGCLHNPPYQEPKRIHLHTQTSIVIISACFKHQSSFQSSLFRFVRFIVSLYPPLWFCLWIAPASMWYLNIERWLCKILGGNRTHGNTTITLENILSFVTGSEHRPTLGFALNPKVLFVHLDDDICRLPTAQTCPNELRLFITKNLKDEKVLYPLFDSAFSSSFFGLQ